MCRTHAKVSSFAFAQVRHPLPVYLSGVCLLISRNILTWAALEDASALPSFDSNSSPKFPEFETTGLDSSLIPEFAKTTLAESGQLLSKLQSTFGDKAAESAPLPAASEVSTVAGEQTT